MSYYEKYIKYKKKYMNIKSKLMHGGVGVGPTDQPTKPSLKGVIKKVIMAQKVIKKLSLYKYDPALAKPEIIQNPEILFGVGQPNNDAASTIKHLLAEPPYKEMVDTGFFKFVQLKDILGLYRPTLKLGEGSFGQTFQTNNNYALKLLALYKYYGENEGQDPDFESLVNEALAGFKLRNCPDVAKVHQIFYDEEHNQMFIVMDLISGKNLEGILETVPGNTRLEKILTLWKKDEDLIEKVINPIIKGLRCIHNKGIAHRDIKNENVMYDTNKQRAFIIDLGLACIGPCNGPFSGTMAYWPPEYYPDTWDNYTYIKGDEYAQACIRGSRGDESLEGAIDYDIYAVGSTIYTLFTGKIANANIYSLDITMYKDQKTNLKEMSTLYPKVYAFALKCLEDDCRTRRKNWNELTNENGLKV